MVEQWIGIEQIAAELQYTKREAWEYVRSIGLLSVNPRKMDLARFTREEYEAARDRAKTPILPRARTGALAHPPAPQPASEPSAARARAAANSAAKLARLRGGKPAQS